MERTFATRLREIPVLLDKAPVRYSRTASEACLKAADEIEALRAVLAECEEYFDNRADADQPAGADYPTPNDKMRLLVARLGVK